MTISRQEPDPANTESQGEQPLLELHAGPWWDDLQPGVRMRSRRRTITETDLVSFINATWLHEELFAVIEDEPDAAIKGRVVPGALVYSYAEGLMLPSMQGSGLAFLGMTLELKAPIHVGDTIRVEAEVIERRPTSKPGRGLVRTRNRVLNQRDEVVLIYEPLRMMRMRPVSSEP